MRTSHRLYDLSSAPAQINGFYVHFSWSVLINGYYPGQNQLIVNIRWGRGKGVVEKNAIGNGFETNVVHIRIFHTFRTAWNGFVKKRVS